MDLLCNGIISPRIFICMNLHLLPEESIFHLPLPFFFFKKNLPLVLLSVDLSVFCNLGILVLAKVEAMVKEAV